MFDCPPETSFEAILNAMDQQVAVLDPQGRLTWVNRAWRTYWIENDGDPDMDWRGVDYLGPCLAAARSGDSSAKAAAEGLCQLIAGQSDGFQVEYPCNGADEKRWFIMRARNAVVGTQNALIVTHEDITERKRLEDRCWQLANIDEATTLANRRRFDAFLQEKWTAARDTGTPISLAVIDVDHFKRFNDTFGHQAGDTCLRRLGRLINNLVRPDLDLVARYGGDEFVVVFPDTGHEAATSVIDTIRRVVNSPCPRPRVEPSALPVTVTVGLATLVPGPSDENTPDRLFRLADQDLYKGKARNRAGAGQHNENTFARVGGHQPRCRGYRIVVSAKSARRVSRLTSG